MTVFSRELTGVGLLTSSKVDCLTKIVDEMATAGIISDKDAFLTDLLQRESIYTTGIGLGIAIPHLRAPEITRLRSAVYLLDSEIDYESVDHKGVKLVIMFAIPAKEMNEYLKIIGRVTGFLRVEENRKRVFAIEDKEELYKLFRGFEDEV
ncbi:MAG: PTS sugar transporter subunit IIA [Candidatus Cloacimonadia bacterium]